MKDLKVLKKQSIYLIIMSFLVLGVLTSYALGSFGTVLTGNQVSSVSTCSLDIDFVDENPITLLAGIPIDDVDANNYEPYVVTVKNNSSNCKDVNYVLTMGSLCTNCDKANGVCAVGDNTCNCNDGYQIDSSLIKYSVKNMKTGIVTSGIDPYNNLSLRGTIKDAGDTATYEIKMWISSSATNNDIYVSNGSGSYLEDGNGDYVAKDFCSKIKLDVDTQKTLATAIMEQGVVTSGDGLYVSTATNDGKPTYYYRGDVSNNCISFANETWRIVRINEDGTIRIMMENGINDNAGYPFNSNYLEIKDSYYSETDANNGAKKTLNDWYETNLKDFDSLIAISTYCEELRRISTRQCTTGNVILGNYNTDFKCNMDANGYGIIKNQKIGLITLAELEHAGGVAFGNNDVYYKNGNLFWTMSSTGYCSGFASVWLSSLKYDIQSDVGIKSYTLRPVINLVPSITLDDVSFVTCPAAVS